MFAISSNSVAATKVSTSFAPEVVPAHLRAARRLALLGVVISQWAALGGIPERADALRWTVWLVAASATAWISRTPRTAGSAAVRSRWVGGLLLLTAIWPLACRAVGLSDVPSGAPASWETAFARALTGAAVVAAGGATTLRIARLAAVSSLFLILFAHAYGDTSPIALRALIVVYVALGSTWLMLDYDARRATVASIARRRSPAWRRWMLVGGLATVVIVAGGVRSVPSARQIGSWFASSGGNLRADSTARSGRQDGGGSFRSDQVPESIGFTESEKYADSPRPSLYDMYNEALGEPAPTITAGRTKVLRQDEVQTSRRNPSASYEAEQKIFATARRMPRPRDPYADRLGPARCLVEGPSPQHLRWTVYDQFDGATWREAKQLAPNDAIHATGRDTWMARPSAANLSGRTVAVTVKVVNLTTKRVPTPVDPSEFRCGAIDLPDYFAWHEEGVLAMRHQKFLPPGAMFEFVSQMPDDAATAATRFTPQPKIATAARRSGDDPEADTRVAELVDSWTAGVQPGQDALRAVCDGLRRHAVVDRNAVVPAVVTDSTVYFLLLAKRGPDYLFASTAADLLARLGYRTRLVSGFYADEASYDDVTDQHALHDEHLHFWAEVQDDDGRWHVVEATPGYEIYRPFLPWYERAQASGLALLESARQRWILILLVLSFGGLLVAFRPILWDYVATIYWHRYSGGRNLEQARRCLRIIFRRATAAGWLRAPGETASQFVKRLSDQGDHASAPALAQIVAAAERHRFASCRTTDAGVRELERCCRDALDYWTINRLRPESRRRRPADRIRGKGPVWKPWMRRRPSAV